MPGLSLKWPGGQPAGAGVAWGSGLACAEL